MVAIWLVVSGKWIVEIWFDKSGGGVATAPKKQIRFNGICSYE